MELDMVDEMILFMFVMNYDEYFKRTWKWFKKVFYLFCKSILYMIYLHEKLISFFLQQMGFSVLASLLKSASNALLCEFWVINDNKAKGLTISSSLHMNT